jgi:AcrR family transcriptional regulator
LTAALACFKERGFTATRLEDVAARAGVTKGTIYLYYPSKEELFKAVVSGELVPNIERLETALDEPAPAATLLEQLFTVWAQHIVPSPVSIIPKLVIAEASNFPELARFYLETAVHRALRLVASILQRGITRGEFRPVDVDHMVYCVLGPLLLTVLWQHSLGPHDDRPLDARAVCRAHLDLLLHGLQMPPPAQTSTREGS